MQVGREGHAARRGDEQVAPVNEVKPFECQRVGRSGVVAGLVIAADELVGRQDALRGGKVEAHAPEEPAMVGHVARMEHPPSPRGGLFGPAVNAGGQSLGTRDVGGADGVVVRGCGQHEEHLVRTPHHDASGAGRHLSAHRHHAQTGGIPHRGEPPAEAGGAVTVDCGHMACGVVQPDAHTDPPRLRGRQTDGQHAVGMAGDVFAGIDDRTVGRSIAHGGRGRREVEPAAVVPQGVRPVGAAAAVQVVHADATEVLVCPALRRGGATGP